MPAKRIGRAGGGKNGDRDKLGGGAGEIRKPDKGEAGNERPRRIADKNKCDHRMLNQQIVPTGIHYKEEPMQTCCPASGE